MAARSGPPWLSWARSSASAAPTGPRPAARPSGSTAPWWPSGLRPPLREQRRAHRCPGRLAAPLRPSPSPHRAGRTAPHQPRQQRSQPLQLAGHIGAEPRSRAGPFVEGRRSAAIAEHLPLLPDSGIARAPAMLGTTSVVAAYALAGKDLGPLGPADDRRHPATPGRPGSPVEHHHHPVAKRLDLLVAAQPRRLVGPAAAGVGSCSCLRAANIGSSGREGADLAVGRDGRPRPW
jgi:hypothetical protein